MTTVRPERAGDVAAVTRVVEAAFPGPAEARLVEALRGAGRLSVSLVAEREGEVVGHIAFSPVRVPGAAGMIDGVGLAPLAVAPAHQRQGVGAALVRAGLAACQAAGAGFVVVLGDPAYYSRFGFAPASRWGLSDEYGGGEAFMALELRPGAITPGAGLVRYCDEFAAVEEEKS